MAPTLPLGFNRQLQQAWSLSALPRRAPPKDATPDYEQRLR